MARSLDTPPLYDPIAVVSNTRQLVLSPVWLDWMASFVQTLSLYLSDTGVFLPHLTTKQRDAIDTPLRGQMIYNTTLEASQVYELVANVGTWKTFTTV